jgi:hypothetical protein
MTKITCSILNTDTNDAFRKAFAAISRCALPFMTPYAYLADLLYDAATAADLEEDGGRFYILVREVGTNCYTHLDEAIEYLPKTDGQAVLRVQRGRFDSFDVKLIYTRKDGYVADPIMRIEA